MERLGTHAEYGPGTQVRIHESTLTAIVYVDTRLKSGFSWDNSWDSRIRRILREVDRRILRSTTDRESTDGIQTVDSPRSRGGKRRG